MQSECVGTHQRHARHVFDGTLTRTRAICSGLARRQLQDGDGRRRLSIAGPIRRDSQHTQVCEATFLLRFTRIYIAFISARRFISLLFHIAARRFRAIRYANRAKKIVTKAVEVRVERPPPTMHEALRDIRELKVLYATLTYDNSRVHTRLIEMHARP